ncbi:VOC family protein [Nocardia pseudobrasiliensis]|nr:VOC family protein [Nocardia pseudobrasiliensis]
MRILASGTILTVRDPRVSAEFMMRHLGFEEKLCGDSFYVVSPQDSAMNLVFVDPGEPHFTPRYASGDEVVIFLAVSDIGVEYDRLRDEAVEIETPIRTIYWADVIEREFRVKDPNGVIVKLSEWL